MKLAVEDKKLVCETKLRLGFFFQTRQPSFNNTHSLNAGNRFHPNYYFLWLIIYPCKSPFLLHGILYNVHVTSTATHRFLLLPT